MRAPRRCTLPGLACAAALLAGCTIPVAKAPAPTLSVPAAWRSTAPIGPRSATRVEANWWRSFGDPALDRLVDLALANNADVRIAGSRLQEYQARQRIVHASELPSLDAALNPGRARQIGPFGAPVDATLFEGNLQASYEVDLFGTRARSTDAARLDYATQKAIVAATRLSVAATTASGYLALRGLDAQLELARATLASRRSSLALAQRQFAVGYSSALEVAQSQAELRATAGVVPQLERAITEQENALNVLTGANPGPIARGAELAALQAPAIEPGLPSALLRRRPDVAAAERAVAASDASLAVARDQMLPSVRLTASLGGYAGSLATLLSSPYGLWSAGGSILAPLFDGGRLRAEADISATARDRAIFSYEAAVRSAFADTENALTAVQRLREQLDQADARRVATEAALRIAHDRYSNGYSSYLEELDAQRNAFSAETAVLQLRENWLAAHVALYRALGGGWDQDTVEGKPRSAAAAAAGAP
ncbi:MAG: efflux transporter outer membrane subunit [Massilia sp.]